MDWPQKYLIFNLLSLSKLGSNSLLLLSSLSRPHHLFYLFTNSLKQQGLYDNSTIVIMADHGYHGLSQNPLLLVKDRNEDHPYTVSDACISYFDLQPSFTEIINNPEYSINNELQKIGSNSRTRYFYYNENDVVMKTYGYARDIIEYITDSKANETEQMEETGVIFAPRE